MVKQDLYIDDENNGSIHGGPLSHEVKLPGTSDSSESLPQYDEDGRNTSGKSSNEFHQVNLNMTLEDINGNNDLKTSVQSINLSTSSEDESKKEGDEDDDKKKDAPPPVPTFQMFRFASTSDILFMLIAVMAAIIGGCSLPFMVVLFGDLTNAFVQHDLNFTMVCANFTGCCEGMSEINLDLPGCSEADQDAISQFYNPVDFFSEITRFGAGCSLIGLVNFICSYIFVTCFNHAAERQVFRIRTLFLHSVLKQDIAWYDTNQTGDFASRMTEDLNKLQEGIGEKIGMFIFFMTTFLASIINAFIHGWELTLVILAAMPVLMIATGIIAKSQTSLTEKELAAYSKAGALAEEVLSAVRTVVAFGGQKKEVERFEEKLVFARKAGIIRGMLTALGAGLMWLIMYSSYALAFWYGIKLIMDDREQCLVDLDNCVLRYDASSLIIVFFSVLMGAMNVGQTAPYVEAFSMARGAAASIYNIIDRVPEIDSSSKEGKIPATGAANIVFKDVHFNYPSREKVKILQGLDLNIKRGETVALVGPSGCGKSTVIQLLQRFYDPGSGVITLEGDDLKKLNISALRKRIGVVGQEPVLFGCTIAENIQYGRENVTFEEIETACKQANAYGFIQKLPKKYDTLVGERGAQLSGGQKQRIAIARALVRNPDILLLDEATSALDFQSESIVQSALDKARSGRTTIIVAHRLSTIRSADKIVTIKDGQMAEIGTHDDLMGRKGLYFSLVTAQVQDGDEKQEEADRFEEEPTSGQEGGYKRQRSIMDRQESITSSVVSDDSFYVENLIEETSQSMGVDSSRISKKKKRKLISTKKDEDEDLPKPDTLRILKTNSKEWPYMTVGALASIVMGGSMPVYAILFGEVLGVLSEDINEAREQSEFYALMFFAVGVIVGSAMFLQVFMFTIAGEHLTLRMRKSAFKAMLSQEIGWFDDPDNSTGSLCSRLSSDAAAIQGLSGGRAAAILQSFLCILLGLSIGIYFQWRLGLVGSMSIPLVLLASRMHARISRGDSSLENQHLEAAVKATGTRLGTILQSVFTIVISIGLALYFEWRLGLVTALFIPVVLVAMYFETKVIMGHDTIEKEAFGDSAKLAVEAITNIRTVAGLGLEPKFVDLYTAELTQPHKKAKKKAHLRGLVFGFAQSVPFFAYATCMYYGGYLVKEDGLPYEDVFKVAEALILGTMMVGQATAFAPNYNKAVIAAARIFKLLDRKPLIDSSGSAGLKINGIEGNIEFRSVNFKYPSRNQIRVLRDLNLAVRSGQKVALVGSSGCGKSTCIQLLQRFYNIESGSLNIEEQNVEQLNVPLVRSKMGIVSQEPVLFDRSLAENIQYGDNERNVSLDEVVEVAKKANIHNFISKLPQGYDTKVGDKGTQLSGGQKQRVAIARALVRNPKILLLDEATSALDTESEKVVQEALDQAQEGRTSITIAHRLSTIQNADKIFVMSHGKVVEQGTHAELLLLNGTYTKLWSKQTGK